jgi:mannitol-1-/sugar-/sorbitol-6-phosphatase
MFNLNCRAILFDLDGTLVESTSFIERLWQDWGLQHGIAPQYMSEVMHGRRAREIIHIVAPHLPIKEEAYAMETAEISNMEGMQAYRGARELLNRLPRKQWAIVTSGTLRVASARLNHAKLPTPEVFITADDVKAGKPAPDGYLLAAKRLSVSPADCVVVEDAPAGVQAGKAAGMKVIGIASLLQKEILSQADIVIKEVADIKLQFTGSGINIQIK